MAEGTPGAFSLRCSRTLFGLLLLMTAMTVYASQANAQTQEGTVRLVPAISSVAAEQGPFAVFIVLEGLEHYGTILYDDDRDTVPDREEESIGLAAFEFTIEYDPAVLAVAGVEQGPGLGRTGRAFQCLAPAEEPGSLSFGCLSTGPEPPGSQGTLTLASVTFRPVGPGSSFLLLEAELAGPLGDDVPVEVIGGAVRITGRPVATATAAAPGGVSTVAPSPSPASGRASPQPGDGSASTPTPSSGAATVAPAGPTASETDETPQAPSATAASGESPTPPAPTAPAAENDDEPKELTVQGRDLEAQNDGSAADGRSRSSIALWAAAALAILAAAGALGVTAFRWQRRKQRPGG